MHHHFLATVGSNLLDVEHAALRGQLHAVQRRTGMHPELAALIPWVLDGTGHKDLP